MFSLLLVTALQGPVCPAGTCAPAIQRTVQRTRNAAREVRSRGIWFPGKRLLGFRAGKKGC